MLASAPEGLPMAGYTSCENNYERRVPLTFDLAGATNLEGAPSLRVFCARVGGRLIAPRSLQPRPATSSTTSLRRPTLKGVRGTPQNPPRSLDTLAYNSGWLQPNEARQENLSYLKSKPCTTNFVQLFDLRRTWVLESPTTHLLSILYI
jgi:hypothetical protein